MVKKDLDKVIEMDYLLLMLGMVLILGGLVVGYLNKSLDDLFLLVMYGLLIIILTGKEILIIFGFKE